MMRKKMKGADPKIARVFVLQPEGDGMAPGVMWAFPPSRRFETTGRSTGTAEHGAAGAGLGGPGRGRGRAGRGRRVRPDEARRLAPRQGPRESDPGVRQVRLQVHV